jgi:hypothetical protein
MAVGGSDLSYREPELINDVIAEVNRVSLCMLVAFGVKFTNVPSAQ